MAKVSAILETAANGILYNKDFVALIYRNFPNGCYRGCELTLSSDGKTINVSEGLYVLQGHMIRVLPGTISLAIRDPEKVTGTTTYVYITLNLSKDEDAEPVKFCLANTAVLANDGEENVNDPEVINDVGGKYSIRMGTVKLNNTYSAATTVTTTASNYVKDARVIVGTEDVSTRTPGNKGSVYIQYEA